MFCTSCGYKLQGEARFCSNCGAMIQESYFPSSVPKSFVLPTETLGKIGASVKQRVKGVAERSYPFRIDSKMLTERLKATFHRLGYSVSIMRQRENSRSSESHLPEDDEETLTTITNKKGRGIAVRIQGKNGSTLITLGRTLKDRGQVSSARIASNLPGRWLYEDYTIASKVWAVVGEYTKSFSSENSFAKETSADLDLGDGPLLLEEKEPPFVGRKKERDEFQRSLESTARRKPKHVAIAGGPGIGKSALLREFQRLAEQRGMLVIRREIDPSLSTLQDMALFLSDALDRESLRSLPTQSKLTNHVTRFVNDHGVTLPSFFGVGGGGISAQRVTPSASAVQEKTVLFMKKRAQKLISQGVPGAVFLLDDADHLNKVTNAWAFLKSLFDRINEETSFFLLVVSGANLFRTAAAENISLRRVFNILRLGALDEDEAIQFLRPIVSVSDMVKLNDSEFRRICTLSGRHPTVLEVFATEIIEEIDSSGRIFANVEPIVPKVLTRLGEGFFLDIAQDLTSEERSVVEALCSKRSNPGQHDLDLRLKGSIDLRLALDNLVEKGLAIASSDGRYSLFCPLFRDYIKNISRKNPESQKGSSHTKKKKI